MLLLELFFSVRSLPFLAVTTQESLIILRGMEKVWKSISQRQPKGYTKEYILLIAPNFFIIYIK